MTRKTLRKDKGRTEFYADRRYTTCWRKRAFATREQAERALAARPERVLEFVGLCVYPCYAKTKKIKGMHWHLGHIKQATEGED